MKISMKFSKQSKFFSFFSTKNVQIHGMNPKKNTIICVKIVVGQGSRYFSFISEFFFKRKNIQQANRKKMGKSFSIVALLIPNYNILPLFFYSTFPLP